MLITRPWVRALLWFRQYYGHKCLQEYIVPHFMMTSSNENFCRVTGPLCCTGHRWIPRTQRPVARSFDVFFDLRLNKRLSKQSWGWWFHIPSCSLWCHSNVDGFVQDCINSIAKAMELLLSCTKPSIYALVFIWSNGDESTVNRSCQWIDRPFAEGMEPVIFELFTWVTTGTCAIDGPANKSKLLVASPMSLWLFWWPPTGSSMIMVVVMLLIYSVLHCLYSVGNKITTTTIRIRWIYIDTHTYICIYICIAHYNAYLHDWVWIHSSHVAYLN